MKVVRSITVQAVLGLSFFAVNTARAESPAADAKPTPSVNLLSLGDWGIDAPQRQQVGDTMAAYAAKSSQPIDAALLLGDNFYVKLTGVDDPQIQTFFEKTYDPARLNIPFYAVMGNHDYKQNNVAFEMEYAKRNTRLKIPSRWYRLDLPAGNPLVTVLMLDSDAPPAPLMNEADWKDETAWIAAELAKPHAKWLMAAAHHDIFGNGSHGDNGVLMTTWGELFKKAGVAMYVCGHEHTLQHLEIPGWPISFVIAGGGGAKTKPMLRDQRGPFSKSSTGFAAMHFTPETMTVSLVDSSGKILHAFTRDEAGKVTVTVNSPSDKATTQPLRVIQGIDEKGKPHAGGDD